MLVAVALLFGATLPSTAAAHGCPWDQNAPVVEAGSVSPYWTFGSNLLPQQVSATFTVTDDVAGPQLPTVTATSDYAPITTLQATVEELSDPTLPATSPRTYVAKVTIPEGAVGGTWTFNVTSAPDGCGNVAGPVELGKFFVIGFGWDTKPPTLVSAALAPSSISLSASAGASAWLTLHITDDYTGTRTPVVTATGPDGTVYSFSGTLEAGTINDGWWKVQISLPAGAAAGTWTLRLSALVDRWGNTGADTALDSLTVSLSVSGSASGSGSDSGSSSSESGSSSSDSSSGSSSSSAGSSSSTQSTTITTGSKPYLTFASSKAKLKVTAKGSLAFLVKCNGTSTCKGSVRLYAKSKGKKVKIVSKRISVGAGKTTKVTFTLTQKGKICLKRHKTIKKVSVSLWTDGIASPRTVTVTKVVRS
ncbi:MAG: hypothetical protein QM679_12410 [Patulibacter sp.]